MRRYRQLRASPWFNAERLGAPMPAVTTGLCGLAAIVPLVYGYRVLPGLVSLNVLLALLLAPGAAWAGVPPPAETIVLLRHGEKPPAGLGQLDCRGLNRSLALPAVIRRDFGTPAAIFAPNPAEMKQDDGVAYTYVRPLATIEPTAIAFGLPVDVSHGVQDWRDLARALQAPQYTSAVVVVAWEHSNIVKLARALMVEHGADPAKVPDWDREDFDSVFVLRLAGPQITFEHRYERLNNQSTACPE